MSDQNFSCVLVGGNTLLVECGEVLLQKGHRILAVATDVPRIIQWCDKHEIPVVSAKGKLEARLSNYEFDFLFAITHLAILPESVLQLPRKAAVNFHDGPLPEMAGLNTPAWGLLEGHSHWGITWHYITPGIDEGDILADRRFEIAADETSLSLNTKNFEAALGTFPALIDELAEDRAQPRAQQGERRLILGSDRPQGALFLDWEQSAASLEQLVRATYFGPYENPFGIPKVMFGEWMYVVNGAKANDEYSGSQPGTIIRFEEEGIVVACGEGQIELSGFATLYGEERSIAQLKNEARLEEGSVFDNISVANREALSEKNQAYAKTEAFWVQRLESLEPADLPYLNDHVELPAFRGIDLPVPGDLKSKFGNVSYGDLLTAAFATYLGRLSGKDQFHLTFRHPDIAPERLPVTKVWSHQVPLQVQLKPADSFASNLARLTKETARVRKRGTFLVDTIGRYPQLTSQEKLRQGHLTPIAVKFVPEPEKSKPLPGTMITLALNEDTGACRLHYDSKAVTASSLERMQHQWQALLEHLVREPECSVASLDLLGSQEKQRLLESLNNTQVALDGPTCIHKLFEDQVAANPDNPAVVFEDQRLTYRQLDEKANQLAHHLISLGVTTDKLVGVYIERSLDLSIATMAILKAGGAYVPLDPNYPADRIAYMIEDSHVGIILTQEALAANLSADTTARVVKVDSDWAQVASLPNTSPDAPADDAQLAYTIYTSGSTGNPKGVLVPHRTAANFFVGMDEHIDRGEGQPAWLAVTSLSFDISVLELFYTLTRGYKVVIYLDREREGKAVVKNTRGMDFGLFYWGNDDGNGPAKYRLLLEGAKFADRNGFQSVWTPERHFHAFGGPYPNPAVTGAAVAGCTENISVRSGSCVLPLHHPIRVAEEWAVIDNMTNGRVGLAFASGWQPDDFVLRPENFKDNKGVMTRDIDIVRRLWRGEKVSFPGALDNQVGVVTQPRPVQKELPFWITTAGNPKTWEQAGAMGANLLTHLLGQSLEEVAEKIKLYRKAREEAGHDPATGIVTLMLHTYVGESDDEVREAVRQPMKDYLASSVNLVRSYAWAFPAFKRPMGAETPADVDLQSLSEEELDGILEFAFLRYYETSGLFGTVDMCLDQVDKLKAIGVDDIACLIDFGLDSDSVLAGLPYLADVREQANANIVSEGVDEAELDYGFAAQVLREEITHFQCTPSMARMLSMQEDAQKALQVVQHWMIGGEAFPVSLGQDLRKFFKGKITNMYGPTETTIWSSVWHLPAQVNHITIGKPIANTYLYVLDRHRQPVPIGIPGELYIGGEGVVRGYHERPDLTAERFVENPFRSGERMYRTGDLVRWREDGEIDFLGRIDHQVKIRGYRIELGEIEARLNQHDAIWEGVVTARQDESETYFLAAYIVAHKDQPSEQSVRDHLRATLPEYMVPTAYAFLDAMPKTPNGKIDRKRLPDPYKLKPQRQAAYVAPEGETESVLATVWQAVLGRDQVGIDDNFFDIGGHSLLVVRVHRELDGKLPKPLQLTDLYRFPTIRALVKHIESADSGENLKQSQDRAARRRAARGGRRRR
jgi:natural product biosynthesis luciferase-like monooxygenase protein